MLHLITEVGKPGKNEREKRHFPKLSNQPSVSKSKPRGRRYIPHTTGDEFQFVPHGRHISPKHTEYGLDWSSSLRPIPSPPHFDNYPAEENWPDNYKSLKTFSGLGSQKTDKEWMLYSEGPGYDSTLRSTWDGVHKSSQTSQNEVTHSMRFGKGRIVVNKRNDIPVSAPGDKSYQAAEYSTDFHKYGSTLPVVNFGGNVKKQADTFVPLLELPPISKENFTSREKLRHLLNEINSVVSLNTWRPATPLAISPNNLHGQAKENQHVQSSETLDHVKTTASIVSK